MKKNIAKLFILVCLTVFYACQPEENETFDSSNQESELNDVNATSKGIGKPILSSRSCPSSNRLTLFIKYKNFTTAADKIRIRKLHEKYYTIYAVTPSKSCPNVEFWKVDCAEYRAACQRKCHVEQEIEEPGVIPDDFPLPPLPHPCDSDEL